MIQFFFSKIPVRVGPSFWILPILIAWMQSQTFPEMLLWITIIFFSLLIHELGHAFTAFFFKESPIIILSFFGGMTVRRSSRLPFWKEFLITFNGPLAGLSLAGIAFMIREFFFFDPFSFSYLAINITMAINFLWTFFNLLPILPLDGGQLFSLTLEAIFGVKGLKFSYFFGVGVAFLLAGFLFSLHVFYGAILLLLLGIENIRFIKKNRNISNDDREVSLQNLFQQGEMFLHEENIQEAKKIFSHLREKAKNGILHTTATCYLAKIAFDENQKEIAYQMLLPIRSNLEQEWFSLCYILAAHHRDWKVVAELSQKAYQLDPSGEVALFNAHAFGYLGKALPAIGWLECAAKKNYSSLSKILTRPEFDKIRNEKAFQDFAKKNI